MHCTIFNALLLVPYRALCTLFQNSTSSFQSASSATQLDQRPETPDLPHVDASPGSAGNSARDVAASMALTRQICACQTRDEVLALFESLRQSRGDLDSYQITTFFTTLKKLGGNSIARDARFLQLLEYTRSRFSHYADGRLLATILHSCVRLQANLLDDWVVSFWKASEATMSTLDPQGFSNMLWACNKLIISPPQSWLNCFWAESQAKLSSFKPQELSSTLYACGEMKLTPPQHWMDRFWQSSEAKLSDFEPQNFSNTLYACGKLSLNPPQDWMDRFWKSSAGKLSVFEPQNLSNTLYACSTLRLTPSQEWMGRFCKSSSDKLPRFTEQALANTLLAIAILEQWSNPILQPMWSALQRSLDTSKHASDSNRGIVLNQMFSVYRAAECERPGMLSYEFPGLQEEAKLFRAKKSKTETSSILEKQVHSFLTAFIGDQGISFGRNVWCDKSQRLIRITLCHGDRRVAIEVDGPRHFIRTADGTYELNGLTRLQNRLLEGAGWHVISVRVPDYDTGFDEQKLLEDLLVLVE
jgi:hypothetical protein